MGFGDEWNGYNKGIRRLLGSVISTETRMAIAKNLESSRYSGNIKNLSDFMSMSTGLKGIKGLDGYLFDIASCRNTGAYLYKQIIESIHKTIDRIDKELKDTE